MKQEKSKLNNAILVGLKTGSSILFVIFFFSVSIVIGHVLDIDFIHPYELYHLDPDHEKLSYEEWEAREDQRRENFNNYVLDDIADAWVFPPWQKDSENNQGNPSVGEHLCEGN